MKPMRCGWRKWGVALAGLLLSAVAVAQPANDNFAAAIVLSGTSVNTTGSNVGATREAGEPLHDDNASTATVWWRWTAAADGDVIIDTVGSNYDTILAIYTGSAVNALTGVAANDDIGGGSLQSRVNFVATSGQTYQIAVAGFNAASGTISLNLAAGAIPPTITSTPAPGSTLAMPAGVLGSTTTSSIDLLAVGGGAGSSVQLACASNSGVRVGAAGATPAGTSFNQTVNVGAQPTDLAVAATVAAGAQSLANALVCTATPSLGAPYTLSYSVNVPAAQASDAPPVLSALPPSGAQLILRPAITGGSAKGAVDLLAAPGAGSGSVSVICTADGGLRVGAAGQVPASGSYSFSLSAAQDPADLALAATATAGAANANLGCQVTPSSGAPYTLNYAVRVPAALSAGNGTWVAQGPIQVSGGQSEGITVPRSRPVAGAVHVVRPHPSNASILYVGAVNGGVWRSINATASDPSWTRLTDGQQSLSIGALDIDPTDGSAQTLVAGIGRFSSYGGAGGSRAGLLRTTNGGGSWSALASSMAGRNIAGVAARGSVIVAAVDAADNFTCGNIGLFRSTDSGASFVRITSASGFPSGGSDALAGHPGNPNVLYAALEAAGVCAGSAALNGVYRSADGGANWVKVSSPAMDALMSDGNTSSYLLRIQVAPDGAVVVAIARGELLGVFHSSSEGASWTALGVPATTEGADVIGIHPGGQGSLHLSVAIDPVDSNLVYVGGDRQPVGGNGNFPNSLGARDFSGRLFRGDVRIAAPNTWTSLTHSGTASFGQSGTLAGSAPHADSRSMAFDAAGRLIEGDDGGVYARISPATAGGDWVGLNGDLQITEQHSLAYDPVSRIAMSGNQDNGTMRQTSTELPPWASLSGGDGGGVAVDRLDLAASGRSLNYSSFQNLQGFARRTFSAANGLVATAFPALTVTGGGAAPTGQFVTPVVTNQVQGRRLVIGASNGVYESLDSGSTSMLVADGLRAISFPTGGSLAYGASGNPQMLYVAGCIGSCSAGGDDGLYQRSAMGQPFQLRRANTGGFTVEGVVLDPDDPLHVIVLERNGGQNAIARSTDGGVNWTMITGNFPGNAGALRFLRYMDGPLGDALAAATDLGVFIATEADGFALWSAPGSGLPPAPVYSLQYDASQDLLVAGTLGRGSFSLRGAVVRAVEGGSPPPPPPLIFANGFELPTPP